MPSSMMASGKWKKALLPSLGSRTRERSFTNRSGLSASNTASETPKGTNNDTSALLATDEELDKRVVSALLDTTDETERQGIFKTLTRRSQSKLVSRSQTLSAMRSNEFSSSASLPSGAQGHAFAQIPDIPDDSEEQNLLDSSQESPKIGPSRSGSGLFRPLAKSKTACSPLGGRMTRRMLQSSSSTALASTTRNKGSSPIRKAGAGTDKISRSLTSVLGSGVNLSSKGVAAADDSGGRTKIRRSKTKNVFAKFASVITDHFNTKGSRKEDKAYDASNESTSVGTAKPAQIVDGLPLPRLELAPLPIPNRGTSIRRHRSESENLDFEMIKAARVTGRIPRSARGPAVARKRLTIVDEVSFQEGSPPDDPFSDSASGQHAADLGMSGRRQILNSIDPFQVERLFDSNPDAILDTPPVGFSTPRRRSRSSWARCPTPTRASKALSFDGSDLITFSDAGSPVKSERRRKVPVLSGSPARHSVQGPLEVIGQANVQQDGQGLYDKARKSSGSTRLSSYPPGLTIRHVPRSMGRLTDVPVLSAPNMQPNRAFPVLRKKHPSPSKDQLEFYGKFMDQNLALGVFQDPDELGLSFETPHTSPDMLTPRDANRLMRGSGKTASNIDLRKDFSGQGSRLTPLNTRSRIPQPVKKVSRSRTETTLAKNLYPANAGEISVEDELQWDTSPYKLPSRCTNCGSMNKL